MATRLRQEILPLMKNQRELRLRTRQWRWTPLFVGVLSVEVECRDDGSHPLISDLLVIIREDPVGAN